MCPTLHWQNRTLTLSSLETLPQKLPPFLSGSFSRNLCYLFLCFPHGFTPLCVLIKYNSVSFCLFLPSCNWKYLVLYLIQLVFIEQLIMLILLMHDSYGLFLFTAVRVYSTIEEYLDYFHCGHNWRKCCNDHSCTLIHLWNC